MEDPLFQKVRAMMDGQDYSASHLEWLAGVCARMMERSLQLDAREEAIRKRELAHAKPNSSCHQRNEQRPD